MKARLRILSVTLLLGFGIPAWAHHSFSAVFDAKSPIEASGTVTQVDWRNPHAWIYVDVEDDENNVVNWAFELGSPNGLRRSGWTPGGVAGPATRLRLATSSPSAATVQGMDRIGQTLRPLLLLTGPRFRETRAVTTESEIERVYRYQQNTRGGTSRAARTVG
jgi:hypothetical protein